MPTSVDALKAGMSVSAPANRPRGRPPGSMEPSHTLFADPLVPAQPKLRCRCRRQIDPACRFPVTQRDAHVIVAGRRMAVGGDLY